MKLSIRKHFIFAAVTLILFLIPLLAIGEWAARVRYRKSVLEDSKGFPIQSIFMKSEDPGLVHELRPDSEIPWKDEPLRVNSEGFRDDPFTKEKPAGLFRIAVLGDSVAWGFDVDTGDAFPQILERLLNENPDDATPIIEVLNLAVLGYSTAQEARMLEARGLQYEPDLALVAYVLNDPDEVDGGLARYFNPPRIYLFDAYRRFSRWMSAERIGRTEGGGYPEVVHRLYWDEVMRNLDRFEEMSRKNDLPVAFAQIPAFDWDEQGYPEKDLEERLAKELKKRDLKPLRIFPAFKGRRAENYRYDFWHPNEEGHAIIAMELDRLLRREGLVPRPTISGTRRQTAP